MAGKVKFVKIDTDKYPKIASRYAIQVCISRLHQRQCPVIFTGQHWQWLEIMTIAHATLLNG